MDVVYFLRHIPAASEFGRIAAEEIRYSLRSLCRNYAELGEVHIFGGRPPWLSALANHYPVKQARLKHENTWAVWRQIAAAARGGYLPDRFLMMNDDYFAMAPVVDVPAYYSGTADDWIAARTSGRAATSVGDAMRRTQRVVAGHPDRAIGPREVLSYELHVPLPVESAALADIWPYLDRAAEGGKISHRLAKRTAYANLAGLNRTAVHMPVDVKVRTRRDPVPAGPWVSTADDTFRHRSHHEIGVIIRREFSSACRFELAPPATIPRQNSRTVQGDTPTRRATPRR